jgi:nicotinamidase-related amidase
MNEEPGDRNSTGLRPCSVALLLIDVINPMDFPGAEALVSPASKAAGSIARLKRRARDAGIPAIYVNDNFNCWHLGFRELADRFKARNVPGLPIIRLLDPELESDYYILKPSHSGFFHTGLPVLLERLKVRTTVLTGFAADICVLFTANDAYMRGFHVVVPRDCVASESAADHDHALRHMARVLKADVERSESLDLDRLRREAGSGQAGATRWDARTRES